MGELLQLLADLYIRSGLALDPAGLRTNCTLSALMDRASANWRRLAVPKVASRAMDEMTQMGG